MPKRPTHGSRAFLTGPLVGLTSVRTPVARGQQQRKKGALPVTPVLEAVRKPPSTRPDHWGP